MAKNNQTCRVCGSRSLSPISFSPERTGAFGKIKKNLSRRGQKFFLCDPTIDPHACGLLQSFNHHDDSQVVQTPSGTFRVVREHLRSAATEALELISGRDCSALDIGCNDGTLLSYYPRWVDRFGVDPDETIEMIGEWAWTAQSAFPTAEIDAAFGTKYFDIITCISTLEYCHEPAALLASVRERLVDDGVFVLETLYAPMIMTSNNFEAMTPDIKGLYSLMVLEQLVRNAGMKVFRAALTSKDGGSIRLFITHDENAEYDFDPWSERLARLWDEETVLALRERAPFHAFNERCNSVCAQLQTLLRDIESRAETVHLLGSDAHASILLDWAGPTNAAITHAVAYNHQAASRMAVPGHKAIAVISEAECRAIEPDYLLAPARLKREILEGWRENILAGAKVIFASPEPHIVDAANYSAEYGKTLSQGDSAAGVETLRAILHAAGRPRLVAQRDELTAKSA